MKTYCTTLECKVCGDKITTEWHKSKIGWYLEKEILKYKHRRNNHNKSILKSLFKYK